MAIFTIESCCFLGLNDRRMPHSCLREDLDTACNIKLVNISSREVTQELQTVIQCQAVIMHSKLALSQSIWQERHLYALEFM